MSISDIEHQQDEPLSSSSYVDFELDFSFSTAAERKTRLFVITVSLRINNDSDQFYDHNNNDLNSKMKESL